MRLVFADTGYWVALFSINDDLHDRAVSVSESLGADIVVTTEMVLTEFLNIFSDHRPQVRRAAKEFVVEITKDPNVEVVHQTHAQFDAGLELYGEREDKDWSHTDCASFNVMKAKAITEALAHDHHFEQAGFRALLR